MDDAEKAARAARFIQRFSTEYEAAIEELISSVGEDVNELDVFEVEEAADTIVANVILRVQAQLGLRHGLTQAILALVTHGDMTERCEFLNALQRRSIAATGVLLTMRAFSESLDRGAN